MSDTTETKVYDIYASLLNFKKKLTSLKRPAVEITWIPEDHIRRLKAYEILTAFYQNYSRDYRMNPDSGDTSQNDTIFEAGDPAWLCNRIKAKLIGDKITLSMPGPKSLKNIKALQNQIAAGEGDQGPATAELETLLKLLVAIREREQYLQDWFDENNVLEQIDENETTCSYLGDCVYMPEWNRAESRPGIVTYDPGFFFPFFNINRSSLQLEIPEKVSDRIIIAWEEKTNYDSQYSPDVYIRIWRDIYELRVNSKGVKQCWRQYGYFYVSIDGAAGMEIEKFDVEDMDSVGSSFSEPGNTDGWYNLGIDFLPFVLIPNIKTQGNDFGLSNIHFMIGLFDALINNYTDLKKNSELLGGAVVGLSGSDATFPKDTTTKAPIPIEVQPNTVYGLGESGRMDLLDTSQMQDAILKTIEQLEKKVIRNSDLTEIGAGVLQPAQVPSGVALALMLQPLVDKITPMRNVRRQRYSTLLYMVQKLFQIFGSPEQKALFADPIHNAFLNFGKLVPNDDSGRLDYYIKLGTLVDQETLLETMKADGFEIDIPMILKRLEAEKQKKIEQQQALFSAGSQFEGGGE